MTDLKLLKRVDHLIDQANIAIGNKIKSTTGSTAWVKDDGHMGFRAGALSFIGNLYGTEYSYYKLYNSAVLHTYVEIWRMALVY